MNGRRRAHLRILVATAIVALVAPAVTSAQQAVTILHSFSGDNFEGYSPVAPLIQATDGNFYGTTLGPTQFTGATGTAFKMTAAGTLTPLGSLHTSRPGELYAGLIQATDGNLYGTSTRGGAGTGCGYYVYPTYGIGCGTVFKITPDGGATLLHSFNLTEGSGVKAALIQASDGNFYGTALSGGAFGAGTAFRMTPGGTFTVLHNFAGGMDGANPAPSAALIRATDGNFYGTTQAGGSFNAGTVFRMTPAGTVSVLHAFAGGADGSVPLGAVIQATDGNFYGTTEFGGPSLGGTVFKMTPAGTLTVLHAFVGGGTDGFRPLASLIQATDGNFYGTTVFGGLAGAGTVFKMTPAGNVTVLHAFTEGTTDGAYPVASLMQARDGNLYGTTQYGGNGFNGNTGIGSPRYGVVFRLPVSVAPAIRTQRGDFNGDGKADVTVFRPSTGTWFIKYSGAAPPAVTQWGNANDVVVPGDYDGDGKIDIAIFRPSTGMWFIVNSSTGAAASIQWGNGNDRPVPGDYDGDGKTDIAVFRPSTGTWFIVNSSTGAAVGIQWGNANDVVVAADYDGDGKTDVAIFRPSSGMWFIVDSATGGAASIQWGNGNDVAVPGDYDGDGKTDVAIFRPSTGMWFIVNSGTGAAAVGIQWGNGLDAPVPGDYDGDGKTDIAVFRPSIGTWFILNSSTGAAVATQWGNGDDVPILKRP